MMILKQINRIHHVSAYIKLSLAFALSLLVMTSFTTSSVGNDFFSNNKSSYIGSGNAMNTNNALQSIDPWPEYVDDTEFDTDGERVLRAMEKLQRGSSGRGKSTFSSPSIVNNEAQNTPQKAAK